MDFIQGINFTLSGLFVIIVTAVHIRAPAFRKHEERRKMNPQNNNYNTGGYRPGGEIPGKNKAIASLVLGIISVVCWFFGYSAILSVILGVIGVMLASKSKEEGYDDNIRMAGFILSIIGVAGGAVCFAACVSCTACAGLLSIGSSGAMEI